MARRTLNFETYTSSDDFEPIEVNIGPSDNQETFHFVPMIPGIEIIDLVAGINSDNPSENAAAVRKVLDLAVVDEDRKRFWAFVGDRKNFVGMTVLDNIAISLAEEYMGGVPTEPEPSSSPGSGQNGSGRKAKPSKKAATSTT